MDALREYVSSIVIAVVICSILLAMVRDIQEDAFLRLLCGLILSMCVIGPISHMDMEKLLPDFSSYSENAELMTTAGEQMQKSAMEEIIKERVEAYILDKALEHNADLHVEIILNREMIPSQVRLTGEISDPGRKWMESMLESDLGITKEHQIWIG